MADVITRLKVESKEYDQKMARASAELNRLAQEAQKTGGKINTTSKENVALAQSLGQMQTVASSARGKMAELSKAFVDASVHYKHLSDQEKQSPYGKALAQSLEQLKTRFREAQSEIKEFEGQLNETKQSQGGFLGGLGLDAQSLAQAVVGVNAVQMAVTALKETVQKTIQLNIDFEQSNANLASVLGTNKEGIAALTEDAKRLGAATQYTAGQITELQTELAKLGFTQSEILDATESVQAFATATGADLAGAASLCGAALRAFGLDASEMSRVASTMAVSTTKSALSYEKLANSIATIAPVAHAFGFSIEDTVALLGKLADAGFDASSAATATRNIMLNLADSSGKLAQTLGKPIKSLDDLIPAFVDLKNKNIDLNQALELTDKRSVAAFETFMEGGDKVLALRDSISDCNDELQTMVETRLDTVTGAITILGSAWEGLMLQFDGGLTSMRNAVEGLTGIVNLLNDTVAAVKELDGMGGAFQWVDNLLNMINPLQQILKWGKAYNNYKGQQEAEVYAGGADVASVVGAAIAETPQTTPKSSVTVKGGKTTSKKTKTLDTSALTDFGEIPTLEPLNQELQITIASLKESKKAWKEMLETASTSEGQEQARQGLATVNSQIKNITNGMQLKGMDTKALEELAERSKVIKEGWEDAAKAIGAVGNALSQLEDPAAKVAGMVGAAIAQIALGFAQASAKDSKLGVFGWIAAIAGGLGTMLSTISAIKSATSGYAEGGIVGGSTFSGDTNYIRANSGEMFINQSDQAKLFAAIKGNNLSVGNGGGTSVVRGADIYLSLRNYMQSTGKAL